MQITATARDTAACDASPGAPARAILEQHAAALLRHTAEGTFPLAPEVMDLPAGHYTSPERFEAEKQRVFQRVPLVLAASCELPEAGDYKTLEVAGIPVLLVSIVVPGAEVGTSTTTQTFLAETPPDDAARAAMGEMCAFLAHVVGDEDLPTSAFQQKAMGTGLVGNVRFGRNEGGLQHFHTWLGRVIAADDAALAQLLCQP
jgi:hypothetical protein